MVDQNKTEQTDLKIPYIIQLKTRQLWLKIR